MKIDFGRLNQEQKERLYTLFNHTEVPDFLIMNDFDTAHKIKKQIGVKHYKLEGFSEFYKYRKGHTVKIKRYK